MSFIDDTSTFARGGACIGRLKLRKGFGWRQRSQDFCGILRLGVDGHANGFGETEALAFANRITVEATLIGHSNVTGGRTYTGPPWVP